MGIGRDIMVVGGGRFGCLALKRLGQRVAAVVEPAPSAELAALAREAGAELILQRAPQALEEPIVGQVRWIVPTLPVHLAFVWVLSRAGGVGPGQVPEELLPAAPVVMTNATGGYYLSIATFTCPDDCPQPSSICTHTRGPRPINLVDELGRIRAPGWNVALLVSRQLAPGVGAVAAEELLGLPVRVGQGRGRWLIATACACHAVVDAVVVRGG